MLVGNFSPDSPPSAKVNIPTKPTDSGFARTHITSLICAIVISSSVSLALSKGLSLLHWRNKNSPALSRRGRPKALAEALFHVTQVAYRLIWGMKVAHSVYGVWDGKVHDYRSERSAGFEIALAGLDDFAPDNPTKAFIANRGFLVLDPDISLAEALSQYMSHAASESCAVYAVSCRHPAPARPAEERREWLCAGRCVQGTRGTGRAGE